MGRLLLPPLPLYSFMHRSILLSSFHSCLYDCSPVPAIICGCLPCRSVDSRHFHVAFACISVAEIRCLRICIILLFGVCDRCLARICIILLFGVCDRCLRICIILLFSVCDRCLRICIILLFGVCDRCLRISCIILLFGVCDRCLRICIILLFDVCDRCLRMCIILLFGVCDRCLRMYYNYYSVFVIGV